MKDQEIFFFFLQIGDKRLKTKQISKFFCFTIPRSNDNNNNNTSLKNIHIYRTDHMIFIELLINVAQLVPDSLKKIQK